MASDEKLLVRAGADTEARLATAGLVATRQGDWWEVESPPDPSLDAERLSRELATVVVSWSIHTVVDQIWIVAYQAGRAIRELRYARGEGWFQSGKPLPFESKALKKWLRSRTLSASPEGYDVLECFLGGDKPPPEKLEEPRATTTLYLPRPIAAELRAIGSAHGATMSAVVDAAWQLGKRPLYENLMASTDWLGADDHPLPQPEEPAPPALAHAPIDTPPMHEDDLLQAEKVECGLAVPAASLAEMNRFRMRFDLSLSMLARKAYLIARDRLL